MKILIEIKIINRSKFKQNESCKLVWSFIEEERQRTSVNKRKIRFMTMSTNYRNKFSWIPENWDINLIWELLTLLIFYFRGIYKYLLFLRCPSSRNTYACVSNWKKSKKYINKIKNCSKYKPQIKVSAFKKKKHLFFRISLIYAKFTHIYLSLNRRHDFFKWYRVIRQMIPSKIHFDFMK